MKFSLAFPALLSSAAISSAYEFDQGIYGRDADAVAEAYPEYGIHARDANIHEAIIQAREAQEAYQMVRVAPSLFTCCSPC